MNDTATQCKRIIDYIRENGHITSLEAAKHLNITQLCHALANWKTGVLFSTSRNTRLATARTRWRFIR